MSTTLSTEDYLVMYNADIYSDGKVARVLNENGNPRWTICPNCGIDDFTHSIDCSLPLSRS
jgi:CRISPR/Cas system-associated protein Csx1